MTPHASFLALPYAPTPRIDNLRSIEDDLGAYGPGGFYDAVAVRSGTIAERYLSLDQAMVLGAIGNAPRTTTSSSGLRRQARSSSALKPLMAMEQFGSRDAARSAVR